MYFLIASLFVPALDVGAQELAFKLGFKNVKKDRLKINQTKKETFLFGSNYFFSIIFFNL